MESVRVEKQNGQVRIAIGQWTWHYITNRNWLRSTYSDRPVAAVQKCCVRPTRVTRSKVLVGTGVQSRNNKPRPKYHCISLVHREPTHDNYNHWHIDDCRPGNIAPKFSWSKLQQSYSLFKVQAVMLNITQINYRCRTTASFRKQILWNPIQYRRPHFIQKFVRET